MINIYNLGITDTEYAQLAAQGYDPNLEHQLTELGESIDQARKLARIVGLTQDKPPQTEEEWQEFMAVWGDTCDGSLEKWAKAQPLKVDIATTKFLEEKRAIAYHSSEETFD